jgi:hypothetical protein
MCARKASAKAAPLSIGSARKANSTTSKAVEASSAAGALKTYCGSASDTTGSGTSILVLAKVVEVRPTAMKIIPLAEIR